MEINSVFCNLEGMSFRLFLGEWVEFFIQAVARIVTYLRKKRAHAFILEEIERYAVLMNGGVQLDYSFHGPILPDFNMKATEY
ncbi:hypothetical protein CEXT_509661 [Caerostris extrusa]|uniref:Uncharacterized protein n=1 Tax=Caerostris extrusa TaxID=172846 RepID=A0AAV4U5R0_CAEEX|nr:hypothetical protein CEXT_509661 [Caerostris extrusa]